MAERNYLPQFMERRKPYSSKTRKPPGGDTNDIFGLEERQKEDKIKVHEDERRQQALISDDKFLKKYHETEDIPSPRHCNRKLRRSSSEGRNKSDGSTYRSPPLATGKENIQSNMCSSSESKIILEDKKLEKSESEDEDETSASKKQQESNRITDEIVTNTSARSKLGDSTNISKDENTESVQLKPSRRPCIRVRQPPGGKSSIIF